jgi:GT2 family glycosyltransferase
VRLAGLAPRAAREVLGRSGERTATIEADFPVELLRANRRAMLRGPSAYRRGRSRSVGQSRSGITDDLQAATAVEPGPVKVVLVELSEPTPEFSPHRDGESPYDDGHQYQAVRVFALSHGRPVGEVTLPFNGRVLAAEEVGRRLSGLTPVAPIELVEPAPFVSVVVASSFARRPMLERCVAALGRLDYPRYDVIVVDNRPMADPADWRALEAVGNVRVVAETRPGASAARNRGLAAAAGEIVAFTDDDTVVDGGWLRALAGRFAAEPDADCVTGLVLPGELETAAQIWFEESGNAFAQKYERASYAGGPFTVMNRYADNPYQPASVYRLGEYGTGSNMALRTSVLRDLGGFDEALGPGTPAMAGEDILLFLRLLSRGGRLAYEPGAFVRHWHRRDIDDLLHQTRSYGIGLTAMLTAAVRRDPRHLWGLAKIILPGISLLLRGEATGSTPPPRALVVAKRGGMLIGPLAYLRGGRRMRAWR